MKFRTLGVRRCGAALGFVAAVSCSAPFAAPSLLSSASRPTLHLGPGIQGVWTGHSYAFILTTPKHEKVALVDAGSDVGAQAIDAALREQGHVLTDVDLVVLTHGHRAHTAGLERLPQAEIHIAPSDAALLYGQQAPKREWSKWRLRVLGRPKTQGAALPALAGEVIDHGQHHLTFVSLPGHTPGSLGVLVGGGLLTGDALWLAEGSISKPAALSGWSHEDQAKAAETARRWQELVSQSTLVENTAVAPKALCCTFVVDSHSGAVVTQQPMILPQVKALAPR